MERWNGKLAIVTGASSGIGASIAEELTKAGLQVVGLARRLNLLQNLEDKLKPNFHPYKADISKESEICESFAWASKKFGPIHILINCAGYMAPKGLIDGDSKLWKKVLEINVLGLCIATKEAVKNMRDNKIDGHILHINSILGHKVIMEAGIYGASKFAVTNVTEAIRQELNFFNSKIKISSISPGMVETDMIHCLNIPKFLLAESPKLKCEDIANAALYILGTPPNVQIQDLIIKPLNEIL